MEFIHKKKKKEKDRKNLLFGRRGKMRIKFALIFWKVAWDVWRSGN
jgi:hypothetical protein